ncbi:MAG: hypothetical protein J6M44_08310 [Butyrivibrio sp.]|nr:hypothetical protein [Butyrivibrio sp.]
MAEKADYIIDDIAGGVLVESVPEDKSSNERQKAYAEKLAAKPDQKES